MPLAPLLNACGRPNPERSPLPLLTVLLLLTGEHLEEGELVKRRRGFRTSGLEKPRGLFLVPGGPTQCVGGNVGGNTGRFQKNVPNSSRKSHLDLKSENTLSVFVDRRIKRLLD